MRELKQTGYISNRARQIVACYFTQDCDVDWRHGAAYFEEMLIDHQVTANTGGWHGSSGLGPSTKILHFDPIG